MPSCKRSFTETFAWEICFFFSTDVSTYVNDILDQLPAGTTDYEQLLPDLGKRSHTEAVRVYREEERRDKAQRKQYETAQRRLAKTAVRDQRDERKYVSAGGAAPKQSHKERLITGGTRTVADVSDVREYRGSVSLYFVPIRSEASRDC